MEQAGQSNPIEEAIRIAGSEAKLAAKIGFSQPAVNKAKKKGRCSADMAMAIDRALAPSMTKSKLRPDMWPVDVSETEAA